MPGLGGKGAAERRGQVVPPCPLVVAHLAAVGHVAQDVADGLRGPGLALCPGDAAPVEVRRQLPGGPQPAGVALEDFLDVAGAGVRERPTAAALTRDLP